MSDKHHRLPYFTHAHAPDFTFSAQRSYRQTQSFPHFSYISCAAEATIRDYVSPPPHSMLTERTGFLLSVPVAVRKNEMQVFRSFASAFDKTEESLTILDSLHNQTPRLPLLLHHSYIQISSWSMQRFISALVFAATTILTTTAAPLAVHHYVPPKLVAREGVVVSNNTSLENGSIFVRHVKRQCVPNEAFYDDGSTLFPIEYRGAWTHLSNQGDRVNSGTLSYTSEANA